MKNILFLALVFFGGFLFLSSCQKEMSTENGVAQIAEGSLTDSSGICTPGTVNGTFYTGVTPGSDTAYVQIQVNVTKTGSYSISSNFQNGYEFADSGFFTTTGINTVLLKPVGTPILPTTSLFSVMFDSSLCNFTVSVLDSTGTGIGSGEDTVGTGDPDAGTGNWQFADENGKLFKGTFSVVQSAADTLFNTGGTLLAMAGFDATGDTVLSIGFVFPSGITPGTYHTSIIGTATHSDATFGFATTSGTTIYDAVAGQGAASDITFTVSSYNSTTGVITGTFLGNASNELTTDDDTDTIGILNGSFVAKVP